MKIQEYASQMNFLDLDNNSTAQDYAVHALDLYRNGENIKQAQMLWEYAKEYMLLSTRV
ncbi:hypothetical protein KO527_16295 [Pseudoalteromonas sp. C2R02]|uniref:hypothetical protein n=1 Tax=Pseudoalteromonas sp. C2R02 TaxID=2841565 RepID=UPI001C08C29F|nr:hypothetical protein [Pseudoalteromonas sp. C2R02]MBU2970913.1 hypothetical protein [Pseudoalteromonas sp. C2R02]